MLRPLALAFLCCVVGSSVSEAATSYYVRLRPDNTADLRATLSFDFTHVDTASLNYASILDFATNGTRTLATSHGGPAYGSLFTASNPADSTNLEAQPFFSSLDVPFDALGTQTTFRFTLTELPPVNNFSPDQFSFFFLSRNSGLPYPTDDPLEADALFAIDLTGEAGGDLTVFAPMTFIAPDTLELGGTILDVPGSSPGLSGRIRFTALAPNPGRASVTFGFDVPSPGGKVTLDLLDVAGRRVATVFNGSRLPGEAVFQWSRARLPAGMYLAQLRMGGQTVVRKFILVK